MQVTESGKIGCPFSLYSECERNSELYGPKIEGASFP